MTPENRIEQGEYEPEDYYLAASFGGERRAFSAYSRIQETLHLAKCNLSCFRFQLNNVFHVAVLGDRPGPELEQKLKTLLSRGELTALPPDILGILGERRKQASAQGEWVERHFRPGQRL